MPSSTSVAPRNARDELGFQQTEAYQVMSLGRAQCQAGDYDVGAATLRLAIDKAQATGDVRLAALARVNLGRVLRALGEVAAARAALEAATAWHREAGGGEQAALGECLLAAMDAADHVPGAEERLAGDPRRGPKRGRCRRSRSSPSMRSPASRPTAGDAGTARDLAEAADRRLEAAAHVITDLDRTDAHG